MKNHPCIVILPLVLLWLSWMPIAAKAEDPPPQTKEAVADAKIEAVGAATERLAAQKGALSGLVGVSVRFLESPAGENAAIPQPAYSHHGDKSLLPASTMKTITTGCALNVLGIDYRFPTLLQHDGTIDSATGFLNGNLIVYGSGDPTLAENGWSGLFADWHTALQAAGIRSVSGSVIGDDSAFATQAVSGSWAWDDIGNYYAPPVTGLNFHLNTFHISFASGAVGGIAKLVNTSPRIPNLKIVNEMRTGAAGSGDHGYVYGAPYAETYYLRGSIPKSSGTFSIKGGIPDPAYFCAHRLSTFLKAKGIGIEGEPTTARRGGFEALGNRTDLHTHQSLPLAEMIRPVNHESINLHAEAILKAIGRKASGEGSTVGGAKGVAAFLKDKGIDTTGFDMTDGCGLSRANAVSPNQLTAILTLFHNLPAADDFRKSLPVAGRTGTLKSIGGGTSAEGRILAKSGTIHRVKCYAGYVDCRSGRKAAFAIMVNQYSGDYAPIKSGITSVMARLAEM